jgi:DNA-binding transcriptional LysR family regulator
MDLLQLEHFLAVVDEGSFTRAAERVFRTQPAVSASVKKLEQAIGAPLFARDTPELTLTSEGKELVESARKMLKLRDDALGRIRKIRSLSSGSLSIAAHESAAVYLLPKPLRKYLKSFPKIRIGLERRGTADIPGSVMDREVDVGFVRETPAAHGLSSMLVHSDTLVPIASPRHVLARRRQVTLKDLEGEPFVVHYRCSTTEQILRTFESRNLRCNITAELCSFENVKEFVMNDVGLAIIPTICAAKELEAGTLVRLPLGDLNLVRQSFVIFRNHGYLSESSQQFIEVMKEFALSSS